MIVYRYLTSEEVLSMINNTEFKNDRTIYGENTFNYEEGCSYKHFYVYADHARKFNIFKMIGVYVIPDDVIYEHGFGFYGNIKTMVNNELYHYYTPLPEIIVKEEDMKKEYLYYINNDLEGGLGEKVLCDNDNKKYNEPTEKSFRGIPSNIGYTDYSYADIYYELVCKLAKENNYRMYKVASLLADIDLHNDIPNFFEENIDYFQDKMKEYVKNNENE